jgi:hypothetical protein
MSHVTHVESVGFVWVLHWNLVAAGNYKNLQSLIALLFFVEQAPRKPVLLYCSTCLSLLLFACCSLVVVVACSSVCCSSSSNDLVLANQLLSCPRYYCSVDIS